MFERLESILSQLQAFVEGFDASGLDRAQSLDLYEKLCRAERMMHAAKALAGQRICEVNAWYDTHHKSTAHFMAATAGTTISHQCNMLDVADLLPKLPETDKAFRSGTLTEEKVIDLAFAAALDPDSEEGLLVLAEAAALEEFRSRVRPGPPRRLVGAAAPRAGPPQAPPAPLDQPRRRVPPLRQLHPGSGCSDRCRPGALPAEGGRPFIPQGAQRQSPGGGGAG